MSLLLFIRLSDQIAILEDIRSSQNWDADASRDYFVNLVYYLPPAAIFIDGRTSTRHSAVVTLKGDVFQKNQGIFLIMEDWSEDFETLASGELTDIGVMYDFNNRDHAAHQSTFFQEEYQKPNTNWWYASDNCNELDFAGKWSGVQAWAVSSERSFKKDAWAILDALDLRKDYYVIIVADREEDVEWDGDGDGFVKTGLIAVGRRDGTYSEEERAQIDDRVRTPTAAQHAAIIGAWSGIDNSQPAKSTADYDAMRNG